MKYFLVRDGKVEGLSEEEFAALGPGKTVQEVIKDMTPEEREAFQKERYEKFIKPLMNRNIEELESKSFQTESHGGRVLKRKSWRIDSSTRKDK